MLANVCFAKFVIDPRNVADVVPGYSDEQITPLQTRAITFGPSWRAHALPIREIKTTVSNVLAPDKQCACI